MSQKKQEPNLNHWEKLAIAEAEQGNPFRLLRMISKFEESLNRFKGPVNDDELGRWTIEMRLHYGRLLGYFKSCYKRLYPKGGIKNVKHI